MIPLAEALDHVRSHLQPLGERTLAPVDAVGSTTIAAVTAAWPTPPFDNSAVDGVVVSAADLGVGPRVLRLVGSLAAGDAPGRPVEAGTAQRITTGAPVPPGAAAVAMIEHVEVDDASGTVTLHQGLTDGANIRRAGEDLQRGAVAVDAGVELRPAHVGLLASIGCGEVRVRRRPVVAVLSTGAELVDVGTIPGPGQIVDSNRPLLLATLRSAGLESVDAGRVGDDVDEVRTRLAGAAAQADVVVTSGGVSMGEFDPVKAVLDGTPGWRWMQIAIKPAKPFAFGLVDGVPVLGLPGNPVSSAVSFELIVRPSLRYLSGGGFRGGPELDAVTGEWFRRRPDGKVHYVRVRTDRDGDGRPVVRSAGAQGSHQLSGLAAADGLAVLPDGGDLPPGAPVRVLLLPSS